jgi:hypothetical protein
MPNYLERVLRGGLVTEHTQSRPATVAPPAMAGLAVAPIAQDRVEFQGEANTPTESNLAPASPTAGAQPTSSPLPVWPAASREAEVPPPTTTSTGQSPLPTASVVETESEPIRRLPVAERAELGCVEVAQPKAAVPQPERLRDDRALSSDESTLRTVAVSQPVQATAAALRPAEARARVPQLAPSARRAPEPALDMQRGRSGAELQRQVAEQLQPNRATFTQPPPLQEISPTSGEAQVRTHSGEPHLVAWEPQTAESVMKAHLAEGASGANLARRDVTSKPVEPDRGDRAPTVEPMPAHQAAPAALSIAGGSGSRERRITIGRVDVHVNNESPAPARVLGSRSLAPLPVDILEARFLNRFWMRP